MLLFLYY